MEIKKFNELSQKQIEKIARKHYSHWSQYSELMRYDETLRKFEMVYTNKTLPYGISLVENEDIIAFCVLKSYDLDICPEINSWISDVMIFDNYRNMGYGRKLIKFALEELEKLGFEEAYLWTDKAPLFYQKLGFTYVKKVLKNDKSGYGKLYKIRTDSVLK